MLHLIYFSSMWLFSPWALNSHQRNERGKRSVLEKQFQQGYSYKKKKVKKARPNASCCTQSNPICVQTHWKQLCEEGLEGHGQWKADHGPRVCSCSLEHQQYPGLHEKRDGQQGVEGDCPSLLSPHLAPSGVLCSSLRLQERRNVEWIRRRATKVVGGWSASFRKKR